MIEGFLLGVIATSTLVAAAFFLRFWRRTRDPLFLAFGIAFLIEALNRCAVLFVEKPFEGSPGIYIIRLVSYLLIQSSVASPSARSLTRGSNSPPDFSVPRQACSTTLKPRSA